MKNIVFLAPGVAPPLTEGRKLLVTDLAATLQGRGLNVTVLSGHPRSSGLTAIYQVLRELEQRCQMPAPVDAVAVFPWGTFHGARRWANAWLLRRTAMVCSRFGVPLMPVFYSCDGFDIDTLGRRFGPALAVGRSSQFIEALPLGVRRSLAVWQPRGSALRDVLFLCGYQQPTSRALRNVLEERGLIDLLQAGDSLASAGIRLSIAIPFIREPVMRERLLTVARKLCPRLKISLYDEVDPTCIFSDYDAFLFPYRTRHSVFIPTSLLEAMSVGMPVIASDHTMYRALTMGPDGSRCILHRVGDVDDLAEKVLEMNNHYTSAVECAHKTASHVRKEWTIEQSANRLLSAFSRLSQGGRESF